MKGAASALCMAVVLAPAGLAAQSGAAVAPGAPSVVTETRLELADGSTLWYAIAVPDGYDSGSDPRPLVLALHPGGRISAIDGSFLEARKFTI